MVVIRSLAQTFFITSVIFVGSSSALAQFRSSSAEHPVDAKSEYHDEFADSIFVDSLFQKEISSLPNSRNEFLRLAAVGQKLSIERHYSESNRYFERAYYLIADHPVASQREIFDSYERDHDLLMILYYKTINYLCMGLPDEALVECRRIDEWIRSDHHLGRELVAADPLPYVITGLAYQANCDFDNAVISMKKAKELFDTEYQGSNYRRAPRQLQLDIDELVTACAPKENHSPYGEMVFIWNNGLGPLKDNIRGVAKVKCTHGQLISNNPSFKPTEDYLGNKLLPFYKIHSPNFWSGTLAVNGEYFSCEQLEDVTWYAVRTLQERLTSAGIHTWKKGADWNTLPYSINYVRVPLQPGTNHFTFTIHGYHGSLKTHSFTCEGNGKTNFEVFTTPECHLGALNK